MQGTTLARAEWSDYGTVNADSSPTETDGSQSGRSGRSRAWDPSANPDASDEAAEQVRQTGGRRTQQHLPQPAVPPGPAGHIGHHGTADEQRQQGHHQS